jgi:hypothetical protein
MNAIEQVSQAIAESIAENRIVTVALDWTKDGRNLEETITPILDEIEGVEDPDVRQENNGSLDVWGLHDNQEFRLRITRP